jgi:transposase InsO family protein
MPWKDESVMDQRIEFLVRARQEAVPLAQLCREYGISRQTGYEWCRRLEACGSFTALQERSRRPVHSPTKTPEALEERVVALRQRYGWGARKLQVLLAQEGVSLPEWTINRVLRRQGLIASRSVQGQARQRFVRAEPNQLHQLDFKGEYRLSQGWCYPLSLIDDHSRYLVGLWALPDLLLEGVQEALEGLFQEQGVPEALLMDRGTPWWSTTNGHGLTRLSVWLMEQDIELIYGRPYHPQTRGKVERFHRTRKERTLHEGLPPDLESWQRWVPRFRREYNEVRPHEALGMRCPVQAYSHRNLRPYREQPAPWEYERGVVRRLNTQGCLEWRGRRWFVCEALAGKRVCVEEVEHLVVVSYRAMAIRELDLRTRSTRALVLRVHQPKVSSMSC